jgi:hypothetical protein
MVAAIMATDSRGATRMMKMEAQPPDRDVLAGAGRSRYLPERRERRRSGQGTGHRDLVTLVSMPPRSSQASGSGFIDCPATFRYKSVQSAAENLEFGLVTTGLRDVRNI